jgi:peptidyl-prolyl cis-trans isomerase B (cyclophilin B)
VPSEKRARQRAYREQKRAAEQRRRRRRRNLRTAGAATVVVGIVIALIVVLSGGSGKPVAAKKPTTGASTTTLPVPTTLAVSSTPVAPVCPPATSAGAPKRVIAFTKAPPMCISPTATYEATFTTTAGTFVVELPAAQSPAAVNNFVFLARYHFFDGTSFPRVATGFVIQGGSPHDNITSGPGYSWTGNLPPASCGTGAACYPNYSLAMANSGGPSTNASQFFIVLPGGGAQLSRNYTRFGKVVSGFKAVDQIGAGGSQAVTNGVNGMPPKVTYYIDKVTISEVASSGAGASGGSGAKAGAPTKTAPGTPTSTAPASSTPKPAAGPTATTATTTTGAG